MVKEAIVLAVGEMTSLASGEAQLPRCMVPVNEKPFLSYIIDHLRMQGIQRFIFLLGEHWGVVEAYLQKSYPTLDYVSVINEESDVYSDTIAQAMKKCSGGNVLLVEAEVLFKIELKQLSTLHEQRQAECTMALKLAGADRNGYSVDVDEQGRVVSLISNHSQQNELANASCFLINTREFLERSFPEHSSFANGYLQRIIDEGKCFASVQDVYYVNVHDGEQLKKAQQELRRPPLDLQQVDKSWTLFLDRDGVINDETVGEYVKHWNEFIFSKGVLEMFKKLGERFGRVIVVSNQRGVGKGLMTEADLQSIHFEMQREVALVGGRIDRIFYCTDKNDKCFFRKPNPGMAVQALEEFPDIDLSKSIMVGNKPGDMRFGRSAGMFTVFVKTTNPDQAFPHPDIDLVFPSLYDFASVV